MEDILDSVRRIIHKWVDTATPVTVDINVGDQEITVHSARRFEVGDQVMLRDASVYETGLIVDSIDIDNDTDIHIITFTTDVLNNWTVSQNTQLVKTVYEQFVQGIYMGEPDVIPRYPAITVNGVTRSSEWLTLESSTERYEIEIGVYVQDSTQEEGYRFLLNLIDTIQLGLKRNIIPLVNDYSLTSLAEDAAVGDINVKILNSSILEGDRQILFENEYDFQENFIDALYFCN